MRSKNVRIKRLFFMAFLISCCVFEIVTIHYVQAADEKDVYLSMGIKSRFYTLLIRKIEESKGGWIPDLTSVETISRAISHGVSLGPDIEYYYKGIFIRGFYLQGEYPFPEEGKVYRKDAGVDLGYKWFFIGYRMATHDGIQFGDADIKEHNNSDAVIGFVLRTRYDKPGFIGNFELNGSIRGWFDALSKMGSQKQEFLTTPIIGDGEIGFGYRFIVIPLTININYGFVWSEKPIKDYSGGCCPDIYDYSAYWDDLSYGLNLKVAYTF